MAESPPDIEALSLDDLKRLLLQLFAEIARLKVEQRTTARMVEKGTEPNLWYIEGDRASLDGAQPELDTAHAQTV